MHPPWLFGSLLAGVALLLLRRIGSETGATVLPYMTSSLRFLSILSIDYRKVSFYAVQPPVTIISRYSLKMSHATLVHSLAPNSGTVCRLDVEEGGFG